MGRLTKKNCVAKLEYCSKCEKNDRCIEECLHKIEALSDLRHYENLQDEGLLLILPVPIGKRFYYYSYTDKSCGTRISCDSKEDPCDYWDFSKERCVKKKPRYFSSTFEPKHYELFSLQTAFAESKDLERVFW